MSKILVADDEPYILRSLAFALRQEGHQVTTARDGQEALDHLESQSYELAFLDILMPHHTGFEVAEELHRKNGGLPAQIVFLSAKGMDEDRNRGMDLGASAFMNKPFSPAAINALVKQLCSVQPS